MSKTVYLITGGGFISFGTGCSLTIDAGNVLAMSPVGFGIHLADCQRDTVKSSARLALWASAIVAAPDGALLRWDEDKQEVSMEPELDTHFVETPLLTTLPDVADGEE